VLASEFRPGLPCLPTSGYEQTAVAPDAPTSHLRVLAKPYRRDDLARALRESLDGPAA
jgi:hypothetical protein